MKSKFNINSMRFSQKKKLKGWALLTFLTLTVSACLDVVELNLPDGETRLVVEGTVYYGLPLQEVILSTTAPFFTYGQTPRVQNALVVIEDNTGHRDTLPEVYEGYYKLDKQGELGKSYKLEITLADGQKYGSSYQDLNPVAPIDSIYYTYEPVPFEADADSTFEVAFNFLEPSETDDFYRWNAYINGRDVNQDVTFTNDQFFNGIEVRDVTILTEKKQM